MNIKVFCFFNIVIFLALGQCTTILANENSNSEITEVIGHITYVKGKVDLISLNTNKRVEARVNSPLLISQEIRTSGRSSVKIILVDNSKLDVREFSVVNVKPAFGSKTEITLGLETPISVRMLSGKIKIKVDSENHSKHKKFYLKTPTLIAGVKGTLFACVATTEDSRLAVFSGFVQVANRAKALKQSYYVKKRQEIRVRAGISPNVPVYVSEDFLDNYLENYEINKSQKITRRIREKNTFIDKILLNSKRHK